MKKPLEGLSVVTFESRLAGTICDLIKLQGGTPFSAPAMREVPLENNPEVFLFAEKLFAKEIDTLILLTGVGTRYLVKALETRYKREDILSALRKIIIVPRGPKPIRALKEMEVPFTVAVPEPNTWHEILRTLDENREKIPVKDRVVALQEYGVSNRLLIEGLKERGAKLLVVPIYRWALPEDTGPLKQAIRNILQNKADVAMFTTAVQVEHLFQVAGELKVTDQLRNAFGKMVIASVGPDCSEMIRSFGLSVDVEPESPKMGPLVVATAEKAAKILEAKRQNDCAVEVYDAILETTAREELDGSVFMKACRLEKTPYTPVWLMRQAGRYMKEYRQIREKKPFLELCKDKDLVTQITVHAQETIHADAAIIFSDILLLAESFGLELEYLKGDGPTIKKVIRSEKDVRNLPGIDPKDSLSYVLQAIRQTRCSLKPGIPLLGFAGAPFTLASYLIEGGASDRFLKTKKMMRVSRLWNPLMEKITRTTIRYLNAQIDAGVQAVQIFDTWAGCLSGGEYKRNVLPYSRQLIASIKPGVPVIHFGTGTGKFLEAFAGAGSSVVGVDHRLRLDRAWQKIGYQKAIQGNLDPKILLLPVPRIRKEVKKILDSVKGRDGHIFNLGHGVLPKTPVEHVIALVDMVHELSRDR